MKLIFRGCHPGAVDTEHRGRVRGATGLNSEGSVFSKSLARLYLEDVFSEIFLSRPVDSYTRKLTTLLQSTDGPTGVI
jgi:hypothetical protein